MSNVISITDKLDKWKEAVKLTSLNNQIVSNQDIDFSVSLNHRNGNIILGFYIKDDYISIELTNVGIASLEQVLEYRKKL